MLTNIEKMHLSEGAGVLTVAFSIVVGYVDREWRKQKEYDQTNTDGSPTNAGIMAKRLAITMAELDRLWDEWSDHEKPRRTITREELEKELNG